MIEWLTPTDTMSWLPAAIYGAICTAGLYLWYGITLRKSFAEAGETRILPVARFAFRPLILAIAAALLPIISALIKYDLLVQVVILGFLALVLLGIIMAIFENVETIVGFVGAIFIGALYLAAAFGILFGIIKIIKAMWIAA